MHILVGTGEFLGVRSLMVGSRVIVMGERGLGRLGRMRTNFKWPSNKNELWEPKSHLRTWR